MVIQYRSVEFASTHISMFLHCNRTCEIFLHLNSVGLQSFRFGPEIAYVASCVLDVLKGVRNKTLVGGAKKGKYNTFIQEIIKIARVICMIDTPSEPKRQVVLASMFILLPLISITIAIWDLSLN